MQTNLKKILVYDLETGGLDFKQNSITEFAGVVIDMETLKIVDQLSVMFKPRLDLTWTEGKSSLQIAKVLYKNLAKKEEGDDVKSLSYKGEKLSIHSMEKLALEIDEIFEWELEFSRIVTEEQYLRLSSDKDNDNYDLIELFFNNTYNPQALSVTHMSKELLIDEGVNYDEGFEKISNFFMKYKEGNSKPILAGHNIKKFDNDFTEKLFESNRSSLDKFINPLMIDTLEWARLRWFDSSGGFSLGVCANNVGLTLKEAHRALPDTIANAKFLIKMLESLRGEGSQESKYVRKKYDFNF